MVNKNISEEVVAHWRAIDLSGAMDVLSTFHKNTTAYKSEFSALEIDLTRTSPYAMTRTPEGQRIDLSVLDWETHDTEGLDEFAGHLEWLRENHRDIKYQIGYERDGSRQNPQIRYVRVEYDGKVEERGF